MNYTVIGINPKLKNNTVFNELGDCHDSVRNEYFTELYLSITGLNSEMDLIQKLLKLLELHNKFKFNILKIQRYLKYDIEPRIQTVHIHFLKSNKDNISILYLIRTFIELLNNPVSKKYISTNLSIDKIFFAPIRFNMTIPTLCSKNIAYKKGIKIESYKVLNYTLLNSKNLIKRSITGTYGIVEIDRKEVKSLKAFKNFFKK